MAFASLNRKESSLKIAAAAIGAILVISSAAMIEISIAAKPLDTSATGNVDTLYQNRPFEAKSVLTADGSTWVSFDSSPPGTPADAHVTISDTSGITIVADFHGFRRSNYTSNTTVYDDLEMPGTGSIQDPGKPKLPSLFEYIEIPQDVDVSIDVLAASSANISGYNIRPAVLDYPYAGEVHPNSTFNATQLYFGPEYSNNTFFPGDTTGTQGESSSTSWIMRGHRLLGLSFYPVQYNPVMGDLIVYSQLVIKVKYSIPAQIQPIPESLRSAAFESILLKTILNYASCSVLYKPTPGTASIDSPDITGAEYLIVTTQDFEYQANRLAEWKERKGVPSEVVIVDSNSEDQVREAIRTAYDEWDLVPTYGLLLGDVEFIPANYSLQHRGHAAAFVPMFEESYLWWIFGITRVDDKGYIASDLGYFTLEGNDYLPEMIYGRISVDTEDQARIVVDKILQYEQYPPNDPEFYKDTLFAADLQDRDLDGREDANYPFLSSLETIRHFLRDRYDVHINYSCSFLHYDRPAEGYFSPKNLGIDLADLEFSIPISRSPGSPGSYLVSDSISPDYPNFGWLFGYDDPDNDPGLFSDLARYNITPNVNEGRFLLLYYGHGGSKNMIYPYDVSYPLDGHNRNDRDVVEGWQFPCFNTTFFSDLINGDKTPLVVSIACDTGWFDGETDEDYLVLNSLVNTENPSNPFEDYANECFAENITRLEGGGAIAAISASRPVSSEASKHLMNGLIQAFWPGFLGSTNQPIYEMGTALLFAKLYAKRNINLDILFENTRTVFEAYHLFGDPETRLWTDTPTWVNVTYPHSVGTSNPQRFAVTVVESFTGDPVNFAKVCIQQDNENDEYDIYQVGYTDSNGQVIFDVDPTANPSHLNLTVTKHNVRPWITTINVVQSDASISVSPNPVIEEDILTITFNEFLTETSKSVFIEGYRIADLLPGVTEYHWQVVPGPTRFLNVRVWSSTGLTVDCFQRVSSADGPDPYIYSQNDPSTWEDPAGEAVWDNPDIRIYLDSTEVSSLTQGQSNRIDIAVHNRGNDMDSNALVTLSWAPIGAGVSWHWIGEYEVDVDRGMTEIATFTFDPELGQTACLRVDISHDDERVENRVNNIGYENVDVISMSSPGTGPFQIGNPTDTTGYLFIKVKQLGTYENVWNASILDYSSQAMNAGMNDTVTLFIDSLDDMGIDEGRLFKVEIFINCVLVGGMVFNATEVEITTIPPPFDPFWIVLIASGVLVVAGVVYVIVKRR